MSRQIARRYAQALFAVLPAKERSLIQEEFQRVLAVLEDPQIKRFFFHPRTLRERKQELIKLLKLSTTLEHFLFLSIEKSRDRLLPQIQKEFESLYLQAEKTTVAQVISAIALTPQNLGEIKAGLEKLSQKTVLLETKVDPKIGGGLIIKMGGQVIDGSVTNLLKRFQENLSS